MSANFDFFDYVNITPDSRVTGLDRKDKLAIIDKSQKGDKAKRGLVIEWDLTHSARRINNRLYSYSGQQTGVDSLLSPFPKPVLKNHDQESEPLGRFIGGEYIDLASEIRGYFRDVRDLIQFQKDYLSDDPEKMYDAMKRTGLITNPKFPGLGKLSVKARISDADAIEKFLDGRYLTFSASHASDRYVCSICGEDWIKDGICEHRPGRIYDGEVCVHITGNWLIKEGSVVNSPADDMSILRSMNISDAVGLPEFVSDPEFWQADSTSIFMTDSTIQDLELDMTVKTEAIELLDPRDYARKLVEGDEEVKEFTDALMGETVFEINYLMRIHDSLHHNYDWELKYRRDGEELQIPSDVFKLHGRLHDLAMEKDFRGSIINGALDGFDASGVESEEYKLKESSDSDPEEGLEDGKTEGAVDEDPDRTTDTPNDSDTEGASGEAAQVDSEPEVEAEVETEDNDTVDPKLVDALYELLKARLEKEPDPEPKDGEGGEAETGDTVDLKDYEGALSLVEDYKTRLVSALDKLAELKGKKVSENCEDKLEELWDWFGTMDSEDSSILKHAGKLQDPSEGILDKEPKSEDKKVPELKGYEKRVYDAYQKLFEDKGEDAAEAYLRDQKRYLPRGFHPSKYQLSKEN